MKKIFIVELLLACSLIFSCTSRSSYIPETVYQLNLTGDDFIFGPVVEAELKYDPEKITMFDDLKCAALDGTEWDTILYPRYTILNKNGWVTIKVIGRAAKLKESLDFNQKEKKDQ